MRPGIGAQDHAPQTLGRWLGEPDHRNEHTKATAEAELTEYSNSGPSSHPRTQLSGPHTYKFQENIPKFMLRLRLGVKAVLQGGQKVLMDFQDVLDVGEEDLEQTKRPESVRSTEQGRAQNSCTPGCRSRHQG